MESRCLSCLSTSNASPEPLLPLTSTFDVFLRFPLSIESLWTLRRRISVLEVDLAKQEKQSQKDLEEQLASEDPCMSIPVFLLIVDFLDGWFQHSKALLHISVIKAALATNQTPLRILSHQISLVSVLLQEEALAAQQREQLEDVAKSEHQAEAALELCRKETCLPWMTFLYQVSILETPEENRKMGWNMGWKKIPPTSPTLPNLWTKPSGGSAVPLRRGGGGGVARPRPRGACSGGDCGGSGDGKLAYLFCCWPFLESVEL